MLNAQRLIDFEREVADHFEAGKIRAPIHLSGGNEEKLIELFRKVHEFDWVFSTYRSHYHALLHGVPRDEIMAQILAGRSMNLTFPGRRFFTSAMVAGILPIAVGAALALKLSGEHRHVWCLVGDMAASIGAYHEACMYAGCNDLPITFVVENNGLSCDSPTVECWGGESGEPDEIRYSYTRTWPHNGTGKWVNFV